ncbi:hypothetical protein ACLOJK_001020 [Asimina triloba]
MAVCRHLWPPFIPFFLLILLSIFPLLASAAVSESDALLELKESFENTTSLESWSRDSDPCDEKTQWAGVVCLKGTVTGLRLGNMGLSGNIDVDALLSLPNLRSVSFVNNRFTGTLPSFNRIGVLKAIYLSANEFSGQISADYFANMASLKKVWFDGNALEGPIPSSVWKMPRLMELHLENNRLSGKIPASIDLPLLTSFNVSNNELEGSIPASLSKFTASAFAGNAGLCGAAVGKDCPVDMDVTPMPAEPSHDDTKKGTSAALICIVVLLLVLLVVAVVKRSKKTRGGKFSTLSRAAREAEEEDAAPSSRSGSRHKESVRKESSVRKAGHRSVPDITLVNELRGTFGLPDLMKAAAEVLGAGGLGSAYKAVMTSGVAVVVKRMRDMDRVGIEGFEAEMRRIGSLHHPNMLPLLAFHSRKEEKLLVYDFAQRESKSAWHVSASSFNRKTFPTCRFLCFSSGDRGEDHAELNWSVRVKIIAGIARGMAYLHSELANSDLPHGNLRSSNVLLRSDLEPMVGDYGFYPLVAPTQAAQSLFAFKSPEYLQYNHVSPKSDVYCLGIVILEILTGKFPSQYLNHGNGGTDVVEWVKTAAADHRETQVYDPEILGPDGPRAGMERLLRIGAKCAEADPAQRPTMREVVSKIEEIAAEEVSSRSAVTAQRSRRENYSSSSGGPPPLDPTMEEVSMDRDG